MMSETQTRRYPANNQHALDRDRAELAAQGWEVASIDYQEDRRGCGLPLIGALMYRPAGNMIVTYRKRGG